MQHVFTTIIQNADVAIAIALFIVVCLEIIFKKRK